MITLNRIIKKSFPKEIGGNILLLCYISYTLAVATTLLDPRGKSMIPNDKLLKKKINIFLVSIYDIQ